MYTDFRCRAHFEIWRWCEVHSAVGTTWLQPMNHPLLKIILFQKDWNYLEEISTTWRQDYSFSAGQNYSSPEELHAQFLYCSSSGEKRTLSYERWHTQDRQLPCSSQLSATINKHCKNLHEVSWTKSRKQHFFQFHLSRLNH